MDFEQGDGVVAGWDPGVDRAFEPHTGLLDEDAAFRQRLPVDRCEPVDVLLGEAEAADSGVDVVGHAIVRRWVSPVGSVIRTLIDRAATACGDVGDPNDRQIVAIGEPHRLLGLRRRGRILDRYDS
ncbi:hypothetical protein [Nocardia nova]|uniref:hypothetical protein n=1 Tax=Nocardia nova TaxID=37330 RepID=UPI001FE7AB1D|nr:hypothetical protein [Nocardia nova]